MTDFHEVRFPMRLAIGAVGGPERRTEIVTLASGQEVRNARWLQSRRRWEVGSAVEDLSQMHDLISFFEARNGRLHGFRFCDPLDHSSAAPDAEITPTDQILGIGDGAETVFQLIKDYDGVARAIAKPVAGTVRIAVNDAEQLAGWTVDTMTGEVQFDVAPFQGDVVSAGFEFDCPVRFESDQINAVIEAFGAGRVVSLSLVELL